MYDGGLYRPEPLNYTAPMELLNSTSNPFGGIIPDPASLPADTNTFATQLQHSLQTWTADGYKLVWLEVPLGSAGLVPVAVAEGFTFHHADEEYVMMLKRLEDEAFVPNYSTHYIGAGGVVITEDNEILVVRERRGRSGAGSFKLPGGHLYEGEHLADAVLREVLEETGIETRFESLVCFRHQHSYRHGKSDIYFVCSLKPLTREIIMQDEEIAECVWMPVNEYMADESVSPFNKKIVRAAIEDSGFAPIALDGYRDPSQVELFFPKVGEEKGWPGVATTELSIDQVMEDLASAQQRSEVLLEVLRGLQRAVPSDDAGDSIELKEALTNVIIMRARLNERQSELMELLSEAVKRHKLESIAVSEDVAAQLGLR